jgi:hypothetical protein
MNEFVASWGPTITLILGIIAFVLARVWEIRALHKDRLEAMQQRESDAASREKESKMQQMERDEQWLQAAIHEAFHEKEDGQLSFKQVRSSLANSAFWESDQITIDKNKLTDQLLRRLLVSMIEKGVLEQVVSDVYSLKFKQTSFAQDVISLNTKAIVHIEEILRQHPSGLRLDSVREKLRERSGIELDRVQCGGVLVQLSQLGLIVPSENNQIWFSVDTLFRESEKQS